LLSAAALENKLFGRDGQPGVLASAEIGTLFLEDIDRLPVKLQSELLKVLREKEVEQPGDGEIHALGPRLIAATEKELQGMGDFNHDLYNRLCMMHLAIPPLRDRKEDIPLLLAYLVKEICYYHQVPQKNFTPAAVASFIQYPWHGNVEEMVTVLEGLVLSAGNEKEIDVNQLPDVMRGNDREAKGESGFTDGRATLMEQIKEKRDAREKQVILSMLEKTGGNKSKAADLLGVHRTTLYKKLKKYNIET
jgi:DNA-binding NtrC family response regulator